MGYRAFGVVWLGLIALSPAQAAEPAGARTGDPAAAPTPRAIECHCRAHGRSYELGARVCLQTPAGHRVAECRMSQNVTSWRVEGEDCSVSARLDLSAGRAVGTVSAIR